MRSLRIVRSLRIARSVRIALKKRFSDGTFAVVLDPLSLLTRRCPTPRQVPYCGRPCVG
ncbi:MAG: hypothetical protein J0I07_23505 [Myxococcales bacterium]|nr:hypothetical protein [Myxococcales bacterium]